MADQNWQTGPVPAIGPVATEDIAAAPAGAESPDAAMNRPTIIQTLSGSAATLPNLTDWENLISFRPPATIQHSLEDRTALIDWPVHRIEDAYGQVNLDYYPVAVTRLPSPGGTAMSAEQLLEHVRRNLNAFVDTNISEFEPYDAAERTKWLSASPLGAVIHIDMKTWGGWLNPDDGSVVAARSAPDHWLFSTIWTTGDGGHPVSGNRQFGFTRGDAGTIVFYTRGADRTTAALDSVMSGTVFHAAHALWLSLQEGIARFVNGNGGAAAVGTATSARFDWPSVKARYHHPTVGWI